MRYSEWKRKKLEESARDADSTEKRKSTGTKRPMRYSEWKRKKRREQEAAGKTVQGWAQESGALIEKTQASAAKWFDESQYESQSGAISDMITQAENWRTLYAEDAQMLESIDAVVNALSGTQSYVTAYYDYYSGWADEEAYIRGADENWEQRQKRHEDNLAAIAQLEEEKENLGFVFPWLDPDWERAKEIDNEKERLEAENRLYERGEDGYVSKVVDDNYAVTQNADFGTVSANRDYTNPSMDEYMQTPDYYDQNQWHYDENGVYRDANGNALETDEFGNWIDPRNKDWLIEDKLGLFLNATEEQRNRAAAGDWGINNVSTSFKEGLDGDWKHLTDQEVDIYYYYLAQNREKAHQYLTDMEQELDRRRTLEDVKQWREKYEEANDLEKLWMNAETVPANLVGSFGAFVSDTVDTLQGEEINPYSTAHTLSHYTRTVRGETAEDLDDTKILGDFFTLGDLYQSGMSMIDSLAATGVGGQFGGVILAMGAAENEAYRLHRQGASKEQIALGAAAAGATELIFEKISLENLDAIKNMASPETLGQWFKTLLVQGGVEASEEMVTELANTVANAFIMGSQSDWQKLVEENNGNVWDALKDKTLDVLHAGISGFASGTASNAVTTGVPYAEYAANRNADAKQMYGDAADALVGEALEIDPNSAFAQKMQDRLGKGKQLTGGQLNRLVEQNESSLRAQDKTAIQQAAQSRLVELGEHKNVSEVAVVLAKQAAGESLSHAEKRLIAKSQCGQQVARELVPDNIRAGSTDSSWAQSIGIERINAEAYGSALGLGNTRQVNATLSETSAAPIDANGTGSIKSLQTDPQTAAAPASADKTLVESIPENGTLQDGGPTTTAAVPDIQQQLQQLTEYMHSRPIDPKTYNALTDYKNKLQHISTTESLLNQKREILQQQQSGNAAPADIQRTQADIAKLEKMLTQQQDKLQTAGQEPVLQKVIENNLTPNQPQETQTVEDNRKNVLDISRTYDRIKAEGKVITDGSHIEKGKLKPNVTYQAGEHEYLYQTDGLGRVCRAIAKKLKLKTPGKRKEHSRNTPGKLPGDEAGHLIADRFGGSRKLDNLVSQAKSINRKAFGRMEDKWAAAIKQGKEVSVDIQVFYGEDGGRPTAFRVDYAFDGILIESKTFKNSGEEIENG